MDPMQHTMSVPKGEGKNPEKAAIKAWKAQVKDLGWKPATDGEGKAIEPDVVVNGGVVRVQGQVTL